MPLPNTYLCTAPIDLEHQLGRTIHSDTLIRTLQRINSRICAPDPDNFDWWYPMQKMGVTCIWIGQPPSKEQYLTDARWVLQRQKKITSMRFGPIPEFTQLTGKGRLICKGWRAIFSKVISSGAATQRQIERAFHVTLETDGSDKVCTACRKLGKTTKATSKYSLCNLHAKINTFKLRKEESRKERLWTNEHPKQNNNIVLVT